MVADQAEATLRIEPLAIECDDARGFLATVLKRVQTERGQRRRFRMAVNTEDATFLAQAIGFEVKAVQVWVCQRPRLLIPWVWRESAKPTASRARPPLAAAAAC